MNCIKNKDIKISIIVPVCNTEKYLQRCLESVVNQTLKDIETIIINDGSIDNSFSVIENFLCDKRVIYVRQENKGPGAARNKGLVLAKGEYMAFVDSDDYIDTDFFEKLYKYAKKLDADIAASSIIRKHETYEKWRVLYDKAALLTNKNEIVKAIKYPDQSYIWNKIYKKAFLEKINFKFDEGVFFEDVTAMAKLLSSVNRFAQVPDINYYYMVNNGNSTVKGVKILKKEMDRYNNQRKAIKMLIDEKIKIPRREYFIKKTEICPFNIPILKIKEDLLLDKELFLLFNLIPVLYISKKTLQSFQAFLFRLFSINKVDGHFLIFILFIKLSIKYKVKVEPPIFNSDGLNKIPREKKIIASLTSFPDRINEVPIVLKTILNQTVKPDKIVLWLAREQFPNKKLPQELLALNQVTIKWTRDLKSYKKLVPSLIEFPDDIIITFDDDVYYEKDTIETLYNSYLKNKNEIQANRTWRVGLNKDNVIAPMPAGSFYFQWSKFKTAEFFNTLIGSGGVLYPPHSLHKDILDEKKFMEILPTQDDIWFWAMAVLGGTKIRLNKGYRYNQIAIGNTQKAGLCKINNNLGKGLSAKESFEKIGKFYPELIKILKNE